MNRYAIKIEYLGAKYSGWQSQINGVAIQDVVESALEKVLDHPVKITASGRTDEGVNATGQVAHFDTPKTIRPYNLCRGVNVFLPSDISVVEAKQVSENFNARKSAIRKTYVYKMYISPFRSPLLDVNHKQIYKQPNLAEMQRAGKFIEGKKDFRCFMSTGSNAKTTVREVYECKVEQVENKIYISVTGNAFLYNMVRAIAGTLLFVGMGRISADDVPELIRKGERCNLGKTMSPHGLTLQSVEYDEF